jgi:NAD(P)H-binding
VKLTIFGATGGTGRRLLERTIAEGHEVTAFVRNPSRMTARHERLEVVVGDVFDLGPVEEAVAGREAVISVLGSRRPRHKKLHVRRVPEHRAHQCADSPRQPDAPDQAGARGEASDGGWRRTCRVSMPELAWSGAGSLRWGSPAPWRGSSWEAGQERPSGPRSNNDQQPTKEARY